RKALAVIKFTGNEQIALLQCTAKYPAPLDTVNLQVISLLQDKFGVVAGLSDHSREPSLAPLGAVALGAKIVEKHFTTDNNLPGPDHGFAILDTELVQLVKDIRNLEKCLGSEEKKVLEAEKELYEFARSRIHASRDIQAGEIFSRENIAILRSGIRKRGLEPEYWEKVLGKTSHRNIPVGEPITMEDL
ncbi:MAG: N-acetylneuraminate synthase family protein, partial [Nanoarchaeota archaeon]